MKKILFIITMLLVSIVSEAQYYAIDLLNRSITPNGGFNVNKITIGGKTYAGDMDEYATFITNNRIPTCYSFYVDNGQSKGTPSVSFNGGFGGSFDNENNVFTANFYDCYYTNTKYTLTCRYMELDLLASYTKADYAQDAYICEQDVNIGTNFSVEAPYSNGILQCSTMDFLYENYWDMEYYGAYVKCDKCYTAHHINGLKIAGQTYGSKGEVMEFFSSLGITNSLPWGTNIYLVSDRSEVRSTWNKSYPEAGTISFKGLQDNYADHSFEVVVPIKKLKMSISENTWNFAQRTTKLTPEMIFGYYEKLNNGKPCALYFRLKYVINGKTYYTNTTKLPEMLHKVDYKDADMEIRDDSLLFPTLNDNMKLTLSNKLVEQSYQLTKNDDNIEWDEGIGKNKYGISSSYGQYSVLIEEIGKCPLPEKTFIIPKWEYVYVDDGKQYNFWSEDKKQKSNVAKLDIKIVTKGKNTTTLDFNKIVLPDYLIRDNSQCSTGSNRGQGYDNDGQSKSDEVEWTNCVFFLNCNPELNGTIVKISGGSNFIPYSHKLNLKAYPNISVGNIDIIPPTCPEDDVVITASGISGGLGGQYRLMLVYNGTEYRSKEQGKESCALSVPSSVLKSGEKFDLYVLDNDTITVKDKNGKDSIIDSGIMARAYMVKDASVVIPVKMEIEVTDPSVKSTCFEENNGVISLDVTQKSQLDKTLKYVWSKDGKDTALVGPIVSGLAKGNYKVAIITDDENQCTVWKTDVPFSVEENPEIVISVPQDKEAQINISCNGNEDGVINRIISGGTPFAKDNETFYTYSWTKDGVLYDANTASVSDLPKGNYVLTVTDKNNCAASTDPIEITEPAKLGAELVPDNKNVLALSCNGDENGLFTIQPKGGTPFDGNRYKFNDDEKTLGGTFTLSELIAGEYKVKVTDSKGCNFTYTQEITQPSAIIIDKFPESPIVLDCYGDKTKNAIVPEVSGGTEDYTYSWKKDNKIYAATLEINNLAAGVYTLTVADKNECTASNSLTVTQPDKLTVKIIAKGENCYGGKYNLATEVLGGNKGYTYLWSNNSTDAKIENVQLPISSKVIVTDAKGCTAEDNATIEQPEKLEIKSITPVDITCADGENKVAPNGKIAVSAKGGSGTLNYNWTKNGQPYPNPSNYSTISDLSAGNYKLKVEDASNCFVESEVIELKDPELLKSNMQITDVKCYGEKSGTINPDITGGTESYTFTWSNDEIKPALSELKAGTYSLTVKDNNNNCTLVLENLTVNQPEKAIDVTFESTPALCSREDGSIKATVSGGTSSYSYLWSNGATTKDISGLKNDLDYVLTVTDANNCTFEAMPVKLTGKGSPVIAIGKVSDVLCHGDETGSITVSEVKGGDEPYSWKWYNTLDQEKVISDQKDLSDVAAGTYKLEVTDAHGCTGYAERSIEQPFSSLEVANDNRNIVVADVDCRGNSTGSITVFSVKGGVGDYKYYWSNGSTDRNPSNLPAGKYSFTVTDAHNCTLTIENIEVRQPEKVLKVDFTEANDVKCHGEGNGNLKAKADGGTSPYTYSWSNGKQGEYIGNLAPGEYKVVVSDGNKCKDSVSWIIAEPEKLAIKSLESTNVTCNGYKNGTLAVEADGGVLPYSYSWTADSYSATTAAVSSLEPKEYTITITDANNCTVADHRTITEPAQLRVWEVVDSHTDVSCFGGSDGRIFTKTDGGTKPYSYQWNIDSTSEQITDITAGEYSLVVKDKNNCEASIDKIVVAQPGKLVAAIKSHEDVRCHGESTGSIVTDVTGGTMPYTYYWNGDKSEVADLEKIPAGEYILKVMDHHNCTAEAEKVVITQQSKIVPKVEEVTPAHCSQDDGSIKASVTGGFGKYTYLWKKNGEMTAYTGLEISQLPTGAYKLIVTDGYNCSDSVDTSVMPMDGPKVEAESFKTTCYHGSDGGIKASVVAGGLAPFRYEWRQGDKVIAEGADNSISGLKFGDYILTVTDNAGCQAFVPVSVDQTDSVTVAEAKVADVLCHGGNTGMISIVSTHGGNGGYTYLWSNGGTSSSISGLVIGTYTLTITDQKGCKGSFSQSISQPEKLEVSLVSAEEPLCHGGSDGAIAAKARGGNDNFVYTYQWKRGEDVLRSESEDISDITAGKYTLVVADANQCSATMEHTLGQPSHVEAIISQVGDVLCHGGSSGYLEASAKGGTPGYTYEWGNGAKGSSISNLKADTYRLVVTDSHGCHDTIFQPVSQPDMLMISATVRDALCHGYSDGLIETSTQGGTMPYTYLWSDGSTLDHLGNLPIGTYKVWVTDAHKCQDSLSQTIQQPDALQNSIEPQHIVCQDSELTIDDGDNGFDSYHWILPDQNIEEGRILTITPSMPEGDYVMVSRNGECYTADTTVISFSDKVLPVKFLMASETYLRDTLVVVEDSKIDGDYSWSFSFSPGMFEDITADVASEHGNLRYLYVLDAGIDTITMYAYNGVCHASTSKTVSVIDSYRPEVLDYSIVTSGVFSRLQIGPNPNNGDFTLFANLSDAAMLDVVLYDVQRSRRIQLDMSSCNAEADHFEIPFHGLGLAQGAYTLLVSAKGDTRQIKFVVE